MSSIVELDIKDIELNLENDELDTSSSKQHSVFRKYFHVPSKWVENRNFLDLVEHRYETKHHSSAFDFIKDRLKKLCYYKPDEKEMLHDYMHFLLADLLTAVKVPFITEEDMMRESDLMDLLNGKTPDLIIKSAGKDSRRPKPLIMDVCVGISDKAMAEKKAIYSTMKAEYSYWHACIKFQHIIFNEQNNYEIQKLNSPTPEFNIDRENFKMKLVEKARELINRDGL
eukprot:gene4403-6227_t